GGDLREPRRGQRPDQRRQAAGQVQTGQHEHDDTADEAHREDTVRRTAYALDGPADRLTGGGGGDHPGQHDGLGAQQVGGGGDEGADREEGPHLYEPREVDRRQKERAEVLGDGADGVDRRLAPREQLATAAAAHRRADGEQQEA